MTYPKGASAKNRRDLVGKRFGRWLVIDAAGSKQKGTSPRNRVTIWLCRCDCGTERPVERGSLLNGYSKSCGCLHRERASDLGKTLGGSNRLSPGEAAFRYLYANYSRGAAERGYTFALTPEEFKALTGAKCHYCGVEPLRETNRPNLNGQYVYNGIDRRDNTKGYTLDNCLPCCTECNFFKKTMTYDDFLGLIQRIYEHVHSRSGPSDERQRTP